MNSFSHLAISRAPKASGYTEEYSELLTGYGLQYTEEGYHLLVGNPKRVQGWMINLSVVQSQVFDLLNVLIPELLLVDGISFKIPKNKKAASTLCGPNVQYSQLGKVVTVFSEDDDVIVMLSKRLVDILKPFRGPEIRTDYCLDGIVYVRYGAVNSIVGKGPSGESESFIYNSKMDLVPEVFSVPFVLPVGVRWPFPVKLLPAKGVSNFMNGNYLLTSVIKNDVKGSVYKALRVTRYIPEWCIIKEARHDMCSDDSGRDVQERLRWQYTLQSALANDVPVPKVYGLFEEDGNTYLAMQFIKGVSLKQVLEDLFSGNTWLDLSVSVRKQIVSYLIEIVDIVGRLHSCGYVHRDITPANFMVNSKGSLVMIDLELAYSYKDSYPSPAFKLGTPGYMSAEQHQTMTPTIKEDLYTIGALMIRMLTSIAPSKISVGDFGLLSDNLKHFVGDDRIVDTVIACLSVDSDNRPGLDVIRGSLDEFLSRLSNPQTEFVVDRKFVEIVIVQSIKTLIGALTSFPGKLDYNLHVEDAENTSYRIGLFSGIAGPLYVISNLVKAGFGIENIGSVCSVNYACIRDGYSVRALSSGLDGSAGAALAMAMGIESQLLDDSEQTRREIKTLLSVEEQNLTLLSGSAGQGIALLRCNAVLQDTDLDRLLLRCVESILSLQNSKGSWYNEGKIVVNGLYHGNAGIILFLLEYYKVYGDGQTKLKRSIMRALDNLTKECMTIDGDILWPVVQKSKLWSSWLSEGNLGVALCYVRAYACFQDPSYQKNAERILIQFPKHVVNSNHSCSFGLSGLGIVYMEAHDAFNTEEWLTRADWLANFLSRTSFVDDTGGHFWVADGSRVASLDVGDGLVGVLQFLLRWRYPSKFRFI